MQKRRPDDPGSLMRGSGPRGNSCRKVERDVMVSPRGLSGDISCLCMTRRRPTRVKYAVRACPLLQVAVFGHYCRFKEGTRPALLQFVAVDTRRFCPLVWAV